MCLLCSLLQGFLLDGYPMDLDQAKACEDDIATPNAIIFFEASNEVLEARLMKRGNFDDNLGSIDKRIENFNAKTLPVAELYGERVKRVTCERTVEEIFADVQKVMDGI